MGPTRASASLTVVIPAHNEEGGIRLAISEAFGLYPPASELLKVIVVDDANTDGTVSEVNRVALAEPRLQLIALRRNIGANRAIYAGVAAATTELVAFLPADRQVLAGELRGCLEVIDDADIVCTARSGRADPWSRKVLSTIYNYLVRALFALPVHDVDSVFLGRREPIQRLLPLLVSRSDFLPVELLVRARRDHLRVREITIGHHPRHSGQASAVSPRFVLMTMRDLLRGLWTLRGS